MELLHNPVRGYAWGSRSALARLQGRPVPSPGPEAELWIGAHPAAPSTVDRAGGPVSLVDVIAADAPGTVGPVAAARFGPRLPYLLKVLAADAPLSLQAHPDAARARAGYAAEEAAGIPLAAAHRNYADPYHKPELLVAVSEFAALCGFREPTLSAELLGSLGVAVLEPVVAALDSGVPDGLGRAVAALLGWPSAQRRDLVDSVVAAAAAPGAAAELTLAGELAERYPGDLGVVVALLLNQVVLAPGEAIWMPAGNLHAYLRGTGVEIMAASDNVLRGGLTPKHVDVPELLRVLRFEVLADPVVRPVPVAAGVVTWPAPVPEFALHRAVLGAAATGGAAAGALATGGAPASGHGGPVSRVELHLPGPREVLCLRGEVRVDDGVAPVTLRAGQAAFGPAGPGPDRAPDGSSGAGPLVCTGAGEVYIASLAS